MGRKIRQFFAYDDQGKGHLIIGDSWSDSTGIGQKDSNEVLRTSTGTAVRVISQGRYEFGPSRQSLRSDDPSAP
jgi:hypothetical protein